MTRDRSEGLTKGKDPSDLEPCLNLKGVAGDYVISKRVLWETTCGGFSRKIWEGDSYTKELNTYRRVSLGRLEVWNTIFKVWVGTFGGRKVSKVYIRL